jgi:hypothetical protein
LGQKQYPSALVRYWAAVRAEVFQSSFILYLYICFSIGQRFRAEDFQIPQHRKALSLAVMRRQSETLHRFFLTSLLLMDNSQLKNLTAKFLDIEPMFKEKKQLLQAARQFRRRLKTKFNEYTFLQTLVGIDVKSDELDLAIKNCFHAFGFDKVECIGKKFEEEDIRLWIGNKLIIFEATGSKNENIGHKKSFQIVKHIPIKKDKFKLVEVYGGFIVNHDNLKPFDKRAKTPFDKKLDLLAKGQNIVLISTLDILNSFINFKKGILTLDNFTTQLCTPGVFKILET